MPYEQDNAGVWWHRNKKQRTRCGTYVCSRCGKSFPRLPSIASQAADKRTIFCSRVCSNAVTAELHRITRKGPGNPAGWSGGRKNTAKGYVLVWHPEHPSANKKGWVLEHRYEMEIHIGRMLLAAETVHHKNGVRSDNRIANLELWCSEHPSGQRVEDLVAWAREILNRYAAA